MDAHKPSAVPAKPGSTPTVGRTGPANAPSASPSTPTQAPAQKTGGVFVRSHHGLDSIKPAPLGHNGMVPSAGAATVFGARLAQFKVAQQPKPAAPGEMRSFSVLKARNEDLKNQALGEKGLIADRLPAVVAFMEGVCRSGRNFGEARQRAQLDQILQFWAAQVRPHVTQQPATALEPYFP